MGAVKELEKQITPTNVGELMPCVWFHLGIFFID